MTTGRQLQISIWGCRLYLSDLFAGCLSYKVPFIFLWVALVSLRLDSLAFRLLVILSVLLLIMGLTLPMMSIRQFYFFESAFSVLSGVQQLLIERKWGLALLIGVFSVVLPLLKLVVLLQLSRTVEKTKFKRYIKLMHEYGRWAMLDVLVVAVLIVTVKLGVLVNVQVHSGLYLFAAAVFLTMYLTHVAVKNAASLEEA